MEGLAAEGLTGVGLGEAASRDPGDENASSIMSATLELSESMEMSSECTDQSSSASESSMSCGVDPVWCRCES